MDSKNLQAPSISDVPSTSSERPSSGKPESRCPFENLVVLDFKTTVDEYSHDHPYEVIQMAASVLYGPGPEWTAKPETDFSEIVRPTRHPKLTRYVKQLTGTSQKDVDKAEAFPEVFEKFEQWLETTGVAKSNFAIVTESRSSIWKLAQYQFILCNMSLPVYLKRFIAITEIFQGTSDRLVEAANQKKEEEGVLAFLDNVQHWAESGVDSSPITEESAKSDEIDRLTAMQQPRARKRGADESIDSKEPSGLDDAPPKKITRAEHPSIDRPCSQHNMQRTGRDYNAADVEKTVPEIIEEMLKDGKTIFMERLCIVYNIERTGSARNAADHATTLRDLIEEMLKDGETILYFNCMMVCYDKEREHKWEYELGQDWKQNFETVHDTFKKVMPLFGRLLNINDHVDYSKCITCEKPLEECGVDWIHRQFPSELFDPSKKICGEILFATEAGLDINKLITSTSDNVEKEMDF